MWNTRARRRRGFLGAVTVTIALGSLFGLASAEARTENRGQANANSGGAEVCEETDSSQKFEGTTDRQDVLVDGTRVDITFSDDGRTVTFTDSETGEEVRLRFCVKAGQDMTGEITGSSFTTPPRDDKPGAQISHTVIYGLADQCTVSDVAIVHADNESDPATNPVGTAHTVVATVTSQNCEAGDVRVLFQVNRIQPSPGEDDVAGGTVTDDDGDGEVSFTYTGPDSEAEDEIFACVNNDGSAPADTDGADDCDTTNAHTHVDGPLTKFWVSSAQLTCQSAVLGTDVLATGMLGRTFDASPDPEDCTTDNQGLVRTLRNNGLDAVIDPVLGPDGLDWLQPDDSLRLDDPSGSGGFVLVDVAFSRTTNVDDASGSSRAGILAATISDGGDNEIIVEVLVSEAEAECGGDSSYVARIVSVTLPGAGTIAVTDGQVYLLDPSADEVIELWLEDDSNADGPEEKGAQAVDGHVLEAVGGGLRAFVADSKAECS